MRERINGVLVVPLVLGEVPRPRLGGVPKPRLGDVPSLTFGDVPSPTPGDVPSPTLGDIPRPSPGDFPSPTLNDEDVDEENLSVLADDFRSGPSGISTPVVTFIATSAPLSPLSTNFPSFATSLMVFADVVLLTLLPDSRRSIFGVLPRKKDAAEEAAVWERSYSASRARWVTSRS